MQLSGELFEIYEPMCVSLIRDRIIDIVTECGGIRETDLTCTIINDFHDTTFGGEISMEMILDQIQVTINQGRVVGIDCQMGERGHTFLFPIGTEIRVVAPAQDQQTRH